MEEPLCLAFHKDSWLRNVEKVRLSDIRNEKFVIDVELFVYTKEAGKNDDLTKSVSYADVYEVIKDITENKTFDLIEALAENISQVVLDKFKLVNSIMVRVKKPEAPVNGIYDYFGVEIRRDRNE